MTSDRPAFSTEAFKGHPERRLEGGLFSPAIFGRFSKFNLRYASEIGETGGEIKSRKTGRNRMEVKFKERRGNHERSAGAGGNEKGARFIFDVGTANEKSGDVSGPALCGLGDVSPEGFTGGPQSGFYCVADQRMVSVRSFNARMMEEKPGFSRANAARRNNGGREECQKGESNKFVYDTSAENRQSPLTTHQFL